MKPIALAAALVALYMLGRSRGRTLGPAPEPEPADYAGDYGAVPKSWTIAYRAPTERLAGFRLAETASSAEWDSYITARIHADPEWRN